MDLFVANDYIAQLEARLTTSQGAPRLSALVELAWHLRQRDSAEAMARADEAQATMAQTELPLDVRQRMAARLTLLRAEVNLLFGLVTKAQQGAQSAGLAFRALHDSIGQGDVHWLDASIALDRGALEQVDTSLHHASEAYRLADDAKRLELCLGRDLIYASFRDPVAAAVRLQQTFPDQSQLAVPVAALVEAVLGNITGLTDNPSASVAHNLASYHAALDSGQVRQALIAITNAVESLAVLRDLDAALELGERALSLARRTGWPSTIGVCLFQIGGVMRLLARHDEARGFLQESLSLMDAAVGSRNYEQVVASLGQLALDAGDAALALDWFVRVESRAQHHGEPDSLIRAWRGQASALILLGQPQQAVAKVEAALNQARHSGSADGQVECLRVLAKIHGLSADSSVTGAGGAVAALQDLNQALNIAATISGYRVSPELLNELAAAQATCGDFASAYANRVAADTARIAMFSQEVQKRALAMQIRQEVDRARAETEHHRQLAATLAETTTTLETLGMIGREITASLDASAVFETLHRHVHELLDATFFAVYLIDPAQEALVAAFNVEAGERLALRNVALDSPTSKVARCARERQELVLNVAPDYTDPNQIPGTLTSLSMLYAPLMVGQRLSGVMTIQSPKVNAYGARERSIFRALCAYGAIALDNAAAYAKAEAAQRRTDDALAELRLTQTRLIEQNHEFERLAITDQLTGLHNRLRLDQTLDDERSRNARYATSFSLVLLDIDNFKLVNDRFGHQMGDQVLIGFARILEANVRTVDVVGRWGGEEFLVITRDGLHGTLLLAEKLRQAIYSHVFALVGRKSASFGVAQFRGGETVTEAMARADAALYRAKQGGRNRVVSGD